MANVCNVPSRTIFTGDNLDILRGINSECVDLIYLDPPFKSDQTYAAPLDSEARGAEFRDVWTLDDMKEEWIDEIEIRRPALFHLINGAKTVQRGEHGGIPDVHERAAAGTASSIEGHWQHISALRRHSGSLSERGHGRAVRGGKLPQQTLFGNALLRITTRIASDVFSTTCFSIPKAPVRCGMRTRLRLPKMRTNYWRRIPLRTSVDDTDPLT